MKLRVLFDLIGASLRRFSPIRAALFLFAVLFIFPCLVCGDPSPEWDFEWIRHFSLEELSAAYNLPGVFAGDNDEGPRFFSPGKKARGLALAVHGLNVKPSMMGDPRREGSLVRLLLDAGFYVARISLRGHGGPLEEMRQLRLSQWLGDAYIQYAAASAEAFRQEGGKIGEKIPVYLLGFSLGALVYEELANEETAMPVRFERAALFSPALAVKPRARSLLLLDPLLSDNSIIKSLAPEEYRAQRGASLGAYKALFELEKRLKDAAFLNNNIPTLVFMDPEDELVSLKDLRKNIKNFGLSNWEIREVSASLSKLKPKYHHLIIDSDCVDPETWRGICQRLLDFFGFSIPE